MEADDHSDSRQPAHSPIALSNGDSSRSLRSTASGDLRRRAVMQAHGRRMTASPLLAPSRAGGGGAGGGAGAAADANGISNSAVGAARAKAASAPAKSLPAFEVDDSASPSTRGLLAKDLRVEIGGWVRAMKVEPGFGPGDSGSTEMLRKASLSRKASTSSMTAEVATGRRGSTGPGTVVRTTRVERDGVPGGGGGGAVSTWRRVYARLWADNILRLAPSEEAHHDVAIYMSLVTDVGVATHSGRSWGGRAHESHMWVLLGCVSRL